MVWIKWFVCFLIIAHSIIGVFGLYRMKVRETVENPDSTFTPVPATITPAGLELDPDAPATLDENQLMKLQNLNINYFYFITNINF